MVKHAGKATESGTKNYADRIWQNNPKVSPNSWRILEGLTVGKIALGTYRMNGMDSQMDAIKKALLNGVNLIDTASNYMDGDSEQFIGETLNELIGRGDLKREEVVLVTKAGYVQGADLIEMQNKPTEDVVEINDMMWHSIHPDYLEQQLDRSLERLNVETIDIFLLHNPEYYLGFELAQNGGDLTEDLKNEYYSRIEKAFTYLERQVQEGRIGCYGISSNTFGVSRDQLDHTDLALVFEAAQKAAQEAYGRKKRPMFRCIEMPINIMELSALKLENTTAHVIDGTEEVSTLELASRMKLSVLANRPLNAFPIEGGTFRIAGAYCKGEDEILDVKEALENIKGTENALNRVIDGWPSIDEQPLFSFTAHGEELLDHIENSIHFDHLKATFLAPHIAMMHQVLDELSEQQPDKKEALDLIQENFFKQARELLDALRKEQREKDAENIKTLEVELRDRVNDDWVDAPLQQIAMNAVASIPGVTSVVTGLRRPAYVDDALGVYEKGDFADPASIIGTASQNPNDMLRDLAGDIDGVEIVD